MLSHWSEAKEYRSETGMKRIHFFVSTPLYMKTTDHCHKSILQRTQRLKSMKSLNCFAFFSSFRINKSWRQNLNRPFCDFRTSFFSKISNNTCVRNVKRQAMLNSLNRKILLILEYFQPHLECICRKDQLWDLFRHSILKQF